MTAPARSAGGALSALARAVSGLRGWRRAAFAAALGAAAAFALPPFHALPLLPLAFTGLLWLTGANASPRQAGVAGWWFGFAHFLVSIHWIASALLIDPAPFGWLAAPAVVGLSAGFALFPALAAFGTRALGLRGPLQVVGFAVAWTFVEWLRGNILTGFPMNLMGTVWALSVPMIQVTALVGVYGLGFLTVLAAASPAALAEPAPGRQPVRRLWLLPAGAFGLLAAVWIGGEARLALAPAAAPTDVRLRVVQANIAQSLKWREGQREAALARHVRFSRPGDLAGLHLTIWPEAAVGYPLDERRAVRDIVSRAVPPGGYLITGAPRRHIEGGRITTLWNSLHAVDGGGRLAATYDKHHLVPFGEYIPLRALLELPKLTYGALDYSPGPGPRTLRLPGLPPFSPLICYEAIFPGDVTAPADGAPARAEWLLNITNDGWFGQTAGPHQHFQAARLRAVEEGLPLVRAANTGISAVVDAHGRVLARIGLDRAGAIDAPLPAALSAPTPFAHLGDWILAILLIPATAAALWRRKRGAER